MSDIYLNNMKNTTHRKERSYLTKNDIDDLLDEINDSDSEISSVHVSSTAPPPSFKLLSNNILVS